MESLPKKARLLKGSETPSAALLRRLVLTYPPDSVPACAGLSSVLSSDDLEAARAKYYIPARVQLVVPPPGWDACNPPIGFGTIYLAQLYQGFRFPPPPFWSNLVSEYSVALGQITPSSIFYITHFLYSCGRNLVQPTIPLFSLFFQMKRSPQGQGFVVFAPRPNTGFRVKNPDDVRKWKTSFMFFKLGDSEITLSECWHSGAVRDVKIPDVHPPGYSVLSRLGEQFGRISEGEISRWVLNPPAAVHVLPPTLPDCPSTGTALQDSVAEAGKKG